MTTRKAHVDVETAGALTVGQTVVDLRVYGKPPNCEIALDADEPRFVDFLLKTLGRRGEDVARN